MDARGCAAVLAVEHEPWDEPPAVGESVCVHGACLTVVRAEMGRFWCDVLEETLRRTSLGGRPSGAPLNLERALRAGDRIGGHIVTGHVDGFGRVRRIAPAGPDRRLEIECSQELLRDIALKGSVACDGVSLTVTRLTDESFEVNLIPFTWSRTAFAQARTGDPVNVETDLLAKYVRRRLDSSGQTSSPVTEETLRRAGFVD